MLATAALVAACGGDDPSADIDPRWLTNACEGIEAGGVQPTWLALVLELPRVDGENGPDQATAVMDAATAEECPEHAEAWAAFDPPADFEVEGPPEP